MNSRVYVAILLVTQAIVISQAQTEATGQGDPCLNLQCQNGGNCTAPDDYPYCMCATDYTGQYCEEMIRSRDPCLKFQCQNGGNCTAPADAPYCECPSNYTGQYCEAMIRSRDPCLKFQCQNGGNCTAPADAPYCECPPNYTGLYCEEMIRSRDPCLKFQCQNGGNCTAPADAPYCECPPNYTGQYCEAMINVIYDPCNGFCLNGGQCSAPADAPMCECADGYFGTRCEQFDESPHPGSCPEVKSGGFGVCGGVFCNVDDNCTSEEKCCRSNCGGRMCANVTSVIYDPCNGFCLNGGQCSAPADAPMCKCADCYFGTRCEQFDESPHPGSCPEVKSGGFGVCGGVFCNVDDNCTSEEKCCRSNCGGRMCANVTYVIYDPCNGFCLNGGQCSAPADAPMCECADGYFGTRCEQFDESPHPGSCPEVKSGGFGVCGGVFCNVDDNCTSEEKCCRSNCGGRMCANVTSVIYDPCNGFCLNGGQCSAPADAPMCKCADGYFGTRCEQFDESPHPGSCPEVKSGGFGVCGGVFCNVDDNCTSEEKCCRSKCGGRMCANVTSVIYDPCNGFCLNGGQCSAPADAPMCKCADGYFGTRCEQFDESPHPGSCPEVKSGGFGVCGGVFCNVDDNCTSEEKCCRSNCGGRMCANVTSVIYDPCNGFCLNGGQCSAPADAPMCECADGYFGTRCEQFDESPHPGSCPEVKSGGFGVCGGVFCNVDDNCTSEEKCCRSNCGGRMCANVTSVIYDPCNGFCLNGGQCSAPADAPMCKCADGYFGTRCEQFDESPHPGSCPEVKSGGFGICGGVFCNVDDNCTSEEKCCRSNCGGRMCANVTSVIYDPCNGFCLNGGQCSAPADAPMCECADGYFGTRCEQFDESPHPGSCPEVKSGGFGVCGGVFCNVDDNCTSEEKCCRSNCGGRMCANVTSVIYDPCNEFCLNGGQCSAPADAPMCECADGYFGTRCEQFDESPHPGSCPEVKSGGFGVCGGVFCNVDDNCTSEEKCCRSNCGGRMCANVTSVIYDPCNEFCLNGGQCSAPADAPMCECADGYFGTRCEQFDESPHPGSCPEVKSGGFGVCGGVFCNVDDNCTSEEKCCRSNCGGRMCANVTSVIYDPCNEFCLNGGQCSAPADAPMCECADGYFGTRCEQFDESPHPGSCPEVKSGGFGVCGGVFCNVDDNCTSEEKCCRSNCGGRMCANVTSVIYDPCNGFCLNGGQCSAPADAPMCKCADGYFGTRCEQFDESPHPGSCPEVKSGGFGVCGGVFCNVDDNCTSEEKCCRSNCGGRMCANVTSVIYDPCNGFCLNGGQCSAPADAPMCKCADGYFGTRCEQFDESPHPGSCPEVKSGGFGVCGGVFCNVDDNCTSEEKCCRSNCGGRMCANVTSVIYDPCNGFCLNGGQCSAPADAPMCECEDGYFGTRCEQFDESPHPGSCPEVKSGGFGVCGGVFCNVDDNCTSEEKCCRSNCGGRMCANVTSVIYDPCNGFCLNGGQCSAPADAPMCKCADGYFGTRCEQFDESPHPGSCPEVKSGGFGICGGVFCNVDDNCTSEEKCCRSNCGGRMCATVTSVNPPPLTCANMRCASGTYCRTVVSCTTCQPQSRCIPADNIKEDTDILCQSGNYTEVVLIENPENSSSYSQLQCGVNVDTQKCPFGTDCMKDQTGSGSCCRGQIDSLPTTEKTGVCPSDDVSVCGGIMCENDANCPGAQKCCSGCGKQCTNPLCGNSICSLGETCVDKQRPCAPGFMCTQALIPTCVPDGCVKCAYNEDCNQTDSGYECFPYQQLDQCGGCSDGKICIDTGIRCIMAPCPESYQCVPVDECGGCLNGQVCKDTGIRCIMAPCPESYQCVQVDECGGCLNGQVCKDTGIRCIMAPCPESYQCVPVDECGGCLNGQVCKDTGIRCIMAPCPESYQCVPVDECGGCPDGQVCKQTGINCNTTQCESFRCLPENDLSCPLRCPSNYACEVKQKACFPVGRILCLPLQVPTCVRVKPEQASCPRVRWPLPSASLYCIVEQLFLSCHDDSDCHGASMRCCSSVCGSKKCTYVKRRTISEY